jgi:hypothetical protein
VVVAFVYFAGIAEFFSLFSTGISVSALHLFVFLTICTSLVSRPIFMTAQLVC